MSLKGEVVWDTAEFKAYLARTLPRFIEESALESLDKSADDGLERSHRDCPVDTGSLDKTLRKEPEAHVKGDEYVVGITAGGGGVINPKTGKEVDYPHDVEYGTSRARPQPFIRPGLREGARNVPQRFEESMERRMR